MSLKTLSQPSLNVIDGYARFKLGNAVCSVPYFNNKTIRARASLKAYIGKGSPEDILEEAQSLAMKNRVDLRTFNQESLKKFLVENNLGIECSGFAYHVLDAESRARGFGPLEKHISFINCKGIFGKIRCSIRPAENCDVSTLASNENSRTIATDDVQPGDMITLTGSSTSGKATALVPVFSGSERDHVLVIDRVTYDSGDFPQEISYSHAVSYPEDGLYGSGIRHGTIAITDHSKSITSGSWTEGSLEGRNDNLFQRALKCRTEIRRLKSW